jgi:hypothetical protein
VKDFKEESSKQHQQAMPIKEEYSRKIQVQQFQDLAT